MDWFFIEIKNIKIFETVVQHGQKSLTCNFVTQIRVKNLGHFILCRANSSTSWTHHISNITQEDINRRKPKCNLLLRITASFFCSFFFYSHKISHDCCLHCHQTTDIEKVSFKKMATGSPPRENMSVGSSRSTNDWNMLAAAALNLIKYN